MECRQSHATMVACSPVSMRTLFLLLLLAPPDLTRPAAESFQPLFIIERSLNANVVHYDARIDRKGELDSTSPVVAYWIMAAEDGRRQELNAIERNTAYGFTVQRDSSGAFYRMALAAQKKREILVRLDGAAVRAEMLIGGHRAYLRKIYISAGRLPVVHLVHYVELFGIDASTGENRYEKVLP